MPLLERRESKDKLIIMTDASNQSLPKGKELERVESAICLGGHARKKFKDLEDYHPEQCEYFLKLIADLYKNDSVCKDKEPQQRLEYHQEHSSPIIDAIYARITDLFENKIIEPNSDLGKAMNYWVNQKEGLTAYSYYVDQRLLRCRSLSHLKFFLQNLFKQRRFKTC